MRIDRRLVIIGVMLVVLSMTMATQYATTKIGYSYDLVHPSESDIRFIGSDLGPNNTRVLWAVNNGSTARLSLNFGNLSANQNKTYTAAFGIVNEEQYAVNITHINVSTTTDYLQIWLHGDRDAKVADDGGTPVYMWSKGVSKNASTTTAWQLAAGNGDSSNMCEDGTTQLSTPWDTTAHVRYSTNNNNDSVSGTSDFVWVQVSFDIPASPAETGESGTIYVHFEASAQ